MTDNIIYLIHLYLSNEIYDRKEKIKQLEMEIMVIDDLLEGFKK